MQVNNIVQNRYLMPQTTYKKEQVANTQEQTSNEVQKTPYNPLLSKYIIKQSSQILPSSNVAAVGNAASVQNAQWQNHFRDMLKNNQANILGVVPRTMNAKDTDGNGLIQIGEESGNFINAIERLDEIKAMGINTLHILPIHPTGKTLAMGTAGSLYAPDRFVEDDVLYLLDTSKFTLHQLCDWEWIEGDGGKILRQKAGYPAYTATLVKYADLICDQPNGQAKFSGIKSTVTNPFTTVVNDSTDQEG